MAQDLGSDFFSPPKRVLLVEDDLYMAAHIKDEIVTMNSGIEVITAADAGKALYHLHLHMQGSPSLKIGAMVLGTWLSYGDAAQELDGHTDPNERHTGVRVYRWLREQEELFNAQNPLWVAVCKSFADRGVKILPEATGSKFNQFVEDLPNNNGRIYTVPYNSFVFLQDIASTLGLPSNTPEVLLPDDYEPSRVVRRPESGACRP